MFQILIQNIVSTWSFIIFFWAITLISCVGKLFTSILNSRLNFFANDLNIISENQAGFRKGYSTVDKNIEKRKGYELSPCRTPVRQGKNSD
jgi:hypothetical protein